MSPNTRYKSHRSKKTLKPKAERNEQSCQSRMTQIGEEVNPELKNTNSLEIEWKGEISLIEAGVLGYIHASSADNVQ